jgi:hypothetical protein
MHSAEREMVDLDLFFKVTQVKNCSKMGFPPLSWQKIMQEHSNAVSCFKRIRLRIYTRCGDLDLLFKVTDPKQNFFSVFHLYLCK